MNGHRVRLCVLACAVVLSGCATGKFRYDRLDEADGEVELRDLEDLMADGTTPLAAELAVERVDYNFALEKDEYRLGSNDLLNIFVMGHPELSSQRINLGEISGTSIRKDGKVHMPIIGALQAAGLTLTEFEAELRTRTASFIVDPQVSVEILQHASQKFYVLGEVPRPGAFAVDGDTTLLEGVGMAGGIPPSADLEAATVIRDGKLMPINIADIVRRGDVSRNIFLKAGDVVHIPDNVAKKVHVLGEVKQPMTVSIERDSVTLAEVLASAGGPTPARARREIAIIRGGYAKPVVYVINLERALLFDDRIKLRSGDRVVVAPTGMSTSSRYMEQMLPFLRGVQALGIAAQGASTVATQAAATADTAAQ